MRRAAYLLPEIWVLATGVRVLCGGPEGTAEEQFLGHPVGARNEQHERC